MKIAFAGVANETASQCEGCGDLMLALSGLILAYNGCRAEAATAQQHLERPQTMGTKGHLLAFGRVPRPSPTSCYPAPPLHCSSLHLATTSFITTTTTIILMCR